VTPFQFCWDLWRQKPRVSGLLCGTVCVILCLTVSVEHQLVTDRQTHDNGIYHASIHGSLGPPESITQMAPSAVFAGLTIIYLGCLPINNMLHLRSNVMLAKSYMQVTMMAIWAQQEKDWNKLFTILTYYDIEIFKTQCIKYKLSMISPRTFEWYCSWVSDSKQWLHQDSRQHHCSVVSHQEQRLGIIGISFLKAGCPSCHITDSITVPEGLKVLTSQRKPPAILILFWYWLLRDGVLASFTSALRTSTL